MSHFRSHIGVIFALFSLLLSMEFCLIVSRAIASYEAGLNSDYNIIIVSQNELPDGVIKASVRSFKSLTPLPPAPILERLKNEMSPQNLTSLTAALPRFYSLKLTSLPSPKELNTISQTLLKIDGIKQVETFFKTHDKLHKLLLLTRNIAFAFTALIGVLGMTLIFKQMRIWTYEHRDRVEIMGLFGAGFWLKSSVLYKSAIFDAVLACILAVVASAVAVFYAGSEVLGISIIAGVGYLISDAAILFASSLIAAIISVSLVMMSDKK